MSEELVIVHPGEIKSPVRAIIMNKEKWNDEETYGGGVLVAVIHDGACDCFLPARPC